MISLNIENFKLAITVIDFELERLPSFQASVSAEFLYSGGATSFSSQSAWFEIEKWEEFVRSLNNLDSSTITDMSNYVYFSVVVAGITARTHIGLKRVVAGLGEANVNINFSSDTEVLGNWIIFAEKIKKKYNEVFDTIK